MTFALAVVGSMPLPGWAKVLALIVSSVAFLMVLRSRLELPEGSAQRIVIGCLAAIVALTLVSKVVHAAPSLPVKPDAIYVECKEPPSWWAWIFWSC